MMGHDLVIVGGGTAGLVAAREARRRHASVLIVHDGPLGGDCTFTGCVPSKALLASAAERMSFSDAIERVHRTVARIAAAEDSIALAREGIDTLTGRARFLDPRTIDVDGRRIRSKRFIVATGARPLIPPIPGLHDSDPLTNETLFQLDRLPTSLIVLGGGPIGCEMAQAFARLGSRVTIVEAFERLLPREEPEAAAVVTTALVADGVDVRTDAEATLVERTSDRGYRLHTRAGDPLEATHLLAAIGRKPSGAGLGLEELGVEVDRRGAIVVDDAMATGVGGIWAAGDVTGRLQFTHVAGRMAWVATGNALSKLARVRPFRFDDRAIPWATFTDPEVAHVGLTEREAAERHPGARVAHLSLEHVDRAITSAATEGFVQLIAAPRRGTRHLAGGRLVGATIVAPTAGELIHEAALAMQTNMFVGRLAQTTHAYPTWSMAVQQAALQFFGDSGGRARPITAHAPAT